MCLGGGGMHWYNHFLELMFLCVWGGGGRTCIRLLLGCALMWVRNTTCQIRLQTSDFIPIAGDPSPFSLRSSAASRQLVWQPTWSTAGLGAGWVAARGVLVGPPARDQATSL